MSEKKVLPAVFCIFFFASCEPYTGASVANSSNQIVKVKISYSNNETVKKYVDGNKGFGNFVRFIWNYQGSDGKLISIDSTDYSATIELKPKDTLDIWGGIHQSDDFDEIDEVTISKDYNKKTIKGYDIQTKFEKQQGGLYIYTVK